MTTPDGFIDSHTHLVHEDFSADRQDVLARAREAHVIGFIVPATDVASSALAIELSRKESDVYAAVGVHPHDVSRAGDGDIDRIRELAGTHPVVAIGEIGLDFFYDFSPPDQQYEFFREQLELASSLELPVIVHTRESMDDAIGMVREHVVEHPDWCMDGEGGRRGVFHCFTGTEEQARTLYDLGFYVSFPGILTFKKSPVIDVFQKLGLERVLLETDAPYMAPVPMRGKRNEPAFMMHTAHKMAEATQRSVDEVADITRVNTQRLFRLR